MQNGARPIVFGFALALVACGGAGDDASDDGTSGDGEPSYAADVQPIFDDNCVVGCHTSGGLGEPLVLDGYDRIVGVASTQAQGMSLVEAGASADSYLVAKLRGAQLDVGGQGGRMPAGGADPLDEATIGVIEDWIDAGAAP